MMVEKFEKGIKNIILNKEVMENIKDFNVQKAKEFVPVDEGDLSNSIGGEVNGNEIIVGSNSEISEFIEYGTMPMIETHGEHNPENPVKDWKAKRKRGDMGTPQQMPFLRPAAYITQKNINKFIPEKIRMEVRVVMK